MQNERLRTSGEYLESGPKVRVHIEGIDHNQFNLQGLDSISRNLDEVIRETPGKTVVYLESGGTKKSDIALVKRRSRIYGLSGGLIAGAFVHQYGTEPSVEFVKKRISQIEEVGLDLSLSRGYLGYEYVQQYYLSKLLDRRVGENVEIAFETHSAKVAEIFQRDLSAFTGTVQGSFDYWHMQDFNASLQVWKEFYQTEPLAVNEREAEIVDNIKEITKKLIKTGEKSTLFMLLGAQHVFMIPQTKSKLDPRGGKLQFTQFINLPSQVTLEIDTFVRNGEEVPDLLLARSVLGNVIRNEASLVAFDEKKLAEFANKYMDLNIEVENIVSSLSIDEIRDICESGQSALLAVTSI